MTWRIRQVPASGAKVRPVRRAFCSWVAMPTPKASTRRLGSETETGGPWSVLFTMSPTRDSMPE